MLICAKCREAGQRSTVRILGTKQTDMPRDVFFDEEGDEHSHNPNIVTTQYRCSNGHRFEERSSWQCHCGWMALKATITFIGEGPAEPTTVVAHTQDGTEVHGLGRKS